MNCSLCDATALRIAGGKGFCKAHFRQAVAADKRAAFESRQANVMRYIENSQPKGLLNLARGGGSKKTADVIALRSKSGGTQ